jgi:hypothetical protein
MLSAPNASASDVKAMLFGRDDRTFFGRIHAGGNGIRIPFIAEH